MLDTSIFVIDKTVFNLLLSSNEVENNRTKIFLNYLKYRKNHKKAYLAPRQYKEIKEKVIKSNSESLLRYFLDFVADGSEITGDLEEYDDRNQYMLLSKNLNPRTERIFMVSEIYHNDAEFDEKAGKKTIPVNIEKIHYHLWSRSEFRDYCFLVTNPEEDKELHEFIKKELGKK